MRKLISVKTAGKILIVFMSVLIIFHILILLGILPSDIVWGSRLENPEQVLIMELIALVITILFFLIIILKVSNGRKYRKLVNIGVWIIFIYFSLNVIGNLASENLVEKAILSPIALFMALLTLRLAIEKGD